MNKLLATLALIGTTITPLAVLAEDPEITEWKTYHSMGCMLLRECKEDVKRVTNMLDIENAFPESNYSGLWLEMQELFIALEDIGVEVYLADEKYFPPRYRGTYSPAENKFYLNASYMSDPAAFAQVMRHEGWHVAQDCMAGTVKNRQIAVIHESKDVPMMFREMAERTYTGASASAVPWEQEALWAGWTPDKTAGVLLECSNGAMWERLEPTPKTLEWLRMNGYVE